MFTHDTFNTISIHFPRALEIWFNTLLLAFKFEQFSRLFIRSKFKRNVSTVTTTILADEINIIMKI